MHHEEHEEHEEHDSIIMRKTFVIFVSFVVKCPDYVAARVARSCGAGQSGECAPQLSVLFSAGFGSG